MTFNLLFFIIYYAVPFIQILGFFLLLFMRVSDTPELKSYCRARKGMAMAFLVVGICSAVQILIGDQGVPSDLFTISLVWLIISSLESFFLTYGVVVMLDINSFSKRSLYFQAVLISSFVILATCSLIFDQPLFRKILFPSYLFFYICQLIYYTRLFLLKYKQYIRNAENYFSGNEANRLRWVKISFFSLLSIGIIALLPILYASTELELGLSILYGIFYTYFLIKYLNYPYTFYSFYPISEVEEEEEEQEPEGARSELNLKLEKWIQEKKYCRVGVTISTLATEVGIGRNSLSNYINNHKKMNFNAWINRLRVNEAKTYLSKQPEMSISDIAYQVGYPNISAFSRQFKTIEGVSPLKWRSHSISVCLH